MIKLLLVLTIVYEERVPSWERLREDDFSDTDIDYSEKHFRMWIPLVRMMTVLFELIGFTI